MLKGTLFANSILTPIFISVSYCVSVCLCVGGGGACTNIVRYVWTHVEGYISWQLFVKLPVIFISVHIIRCFITSVLFSTLSGKVGALKLSMIIMNITKDRLTCGLDTGRPVFVPLLDPVQQLPGIALLALLTWMQYWQVYTHLVDLNAVLTSIIKNKNNNNI